MPEVLRSLTPGFRAGAVRIVRDQEADRGDRAYVGVDPACWGTGSIRTGRLGVRATGRVGLLMRRS